MWQVTYKLGFRLARIWWFLRRPEQDGALVAVWVGEHILLVRQSYRRTLSFPGGRVRSGEDPKEAAVRELSEEIGLQVSPDRLVLVHEEKRFFEHRHDRVQIYELRIDAPPQIRIDYREIVGVRWLHVGTTNLPRTDPFVSTYLTSLANSPGR